MDDHNFILWSTQRDGEPNYDEIIENDNEMDDIISIEEQVEGYEEVNMLEENSEDEPYYIDENIMTTQENLTYLTDDAIISNSSRIGVGMSHLIEQRVQEAEKKIIGDQDAQEEYTAEVITEEDWIQSQGEEIVPVAMEQIVTSENYQEEDVDAVPLQTDQDEYTTQRPYPCDFCSRRFRKKANLMNHMVAHQNIRPHMCNLCGSRYVRKCDLINHLKIHAYNIEEEHEQMPSQSMSGKKKPPKYDDLDFLTETGFSDIPEEDEFNDYNHYSKHVPSTSKAAQKVAHKKTTKSVNNKKAPAPKFEKLTKDKQLKDYNITIGKEDPPKAEYVEKYPITDPRKPFVCQHCGVAFTREKALESHKKLHDSQEPTFDCEVCGDSFYDNPTLEEHMELRHNYSSKVKKTGGKTTSGKVPSRQMMDFDDSNSEYEPDKNVDDLDDDDEFDEDNSHFCDKCDMAFKNAESLKRHVKTHFIKSEIETESDDGKGETNLSCNVCGETFTEKLHLLVHADIHARNQPFKCLLCGETFYEENKIKMHLMENHRDEMTESSCKLCGKQCRDQRSLIKHSWEHSREKNHPCSKCGKTFNNKARLKRHISSHRNKSVICEICQEEFPDGRQLMNHRHSHTKSNQFPCTECGKTFGSRSSQQIHIRIHTGERPYQCRFCWKAFADGGTLRKHERIHTGEKPYSCLVCPRAFNQRVVLREHIRSHHSAPDPQNGTPLTPFYCPLCGDLFSASLELIHHLIEHSDRNTAAKRVQPTGPRKYKRRRKLHDDDHSIPIERKFSRFSNKVIKQEPVDEEISKGDILANSLLSCTISTDIVPFDLPAEIFASVSRDKREEKKNSLPTSSTGRPKMIFTEKAKVHVYDGKRKTKTMIHKQVLNKTSNVAKTRPALHKPIALNDDSNGSETCSNEDDPGNDPLDTLLKRERKLSEKFTPELVSDLSEILKTTPTKFTENRLNNIDEEDLFDSANTSLKRSRRQVVSRYARNFNSNKRASLKQIESEEELDRVIVKQEVLDDGHICGICGDSFDTREKLLSHVPIHI